MFRKRLNQNNFFHKGSGNDSSKSHPKGSASSFDKYSKAEDSKDNQRDETNLPRNNPQSSFERPKDDKYRDPNVQTNSNGSIEDLTKLLLKYHTTRYKEFKRQVYSSFNDSESKPIHHSERHDSSDAHPKTYRSNYTYRSSYSRERGHERHKFKPDR